MARSGFPRARSSVLWLIALLYLTVNNGKKTEAIWLTIPSTGTKCVSEEIPRNTVVLADYYLIYKDEPHNIPKICARVTSPYGDNLHHKENVTHGNFAFTTKDDGNYLACFWLDSSRHHTTPTTLGLDWRIGIAAKDWDSVARREKIEGVKLHLRRLKGLVESVYEKLIYLRQREAEMRTVSERTNARVAWFSIMSIAASTGASVVQIWRLKRFFVKKKII